MCPSDIALDIWEALPEDIKKEILEERNSNKLLLTGSQKKVFELKNINPNQFIDKTFPPSSSSIDGRQVISTKKRVQTNYDSSRKLGNCLCNIKPALRQVYKDGPNQGRYYHTCMKKKCSYFVWADNHYMDALSKDSGGRYRDIKWNRFESCCAENGDDLSLMNQRESTMWCLLSKPKCFFNSPSSVKKTYNLSNDVIQGRLGDCWFLSALAVVAERDDLIYRILHPMLSNSSGKINSSVSILEKKRKLIDDVDTATGDVSDIYEVHDTFNTMYMPIPRDGKLVFSLFIDGFWRNITVDNCLPCIPAFSQKQKTEKRKQSNNDNRIEGYFDAKNTVGVHQSKTGSNSDNDSHSGDSHLDLKSGGILDNYLEQQEQQNSEESLMISELYQLAFSKSSSSTIEGVEGQARTVTSPVMEQLWVPFLEKAYAKSYGCYQSMHGGEIEEALIDLTGMPSEHIRFSHTSFDSERTWERLISFHELKFPMGAATSNDSRSGIVGCHAYSILDVREVEYDSSAAVRKKAVRGVDNDYRLIGKSSPSTCSNKVRVDFQQREKIIDDDHPCGKDIIFIDEDSEDGAAIEVGEYRGLSQIKDGTSSSTVEAIEKEQSSVVVVEDDDVTFIPQNSGGNDSVHNTTSIVHHQHHLASSDDLLMKQLQDEEYNLLGYQCATGFVNNNNIHNAYDDYCWSQEGNHNHNHEGYQSVIPTTTTTTLRLIRLRNPWGGRGRRGERELGEGNGASDEDGQEEKQSKKPRNLTNRSTYGEYTGDFSPSSPLWTNELRILLNLKPILQGEEDNDSDDDGTFWMTYHDFLICFECIDLCKAHFDTSIGPTGAGSSIEGIIGSNDRNVSVGVHSLTKKSGNVYENDKQISETHSSSYRYGLNAFNNAQANSSSGWSSLSVCDFTCPNALHTRSYFILELKEFTWLYATILQKTKRGSFADASRRKFWYSDMSLIISSVEAQEICKTSSIKTDQSGNQSNDAHVVDMLCSGCKRSSKSLECQLPPGFYRISVLHFLPQKDPESYVLRLYSSKHIVEQTTTATANILSDTERQVAGVSNIVRYVYQAPLTGWKHNTFSNQPLMSDNIEHSNILFRQGVTNIIRNRFIPSRQTYGGCSQSYLDSFTKDLQYSKMSVVSRKKESDGSVEQMSHSAAKNNNDAHMTEIIDLSEVECEDTGIAKNTSSSSSLGSTCKSSLHVVRTSGSVRLLTLDIVLSPEYNSPTTGSDTPVNIGIDRAQVNDVVNIECEFSVAFAGFKVCSPYVNQLNASCNNSKASNVRHTATATSAVDYPSLASTTNTSTPSSSSSSHMGEYDEGDGSLFNDSNVLYLHRMDRRLYHKEQELDSYNVRQISSYQSVASAVPVYVQDISVLGGTETDMAVDGTNTTWEYDYFKISQSLLRQQLYRLLSTTTYLTFKCKFMIPIKPPINGDPTRDLVDVSTRHHGLTIILGVFIACSLPYYGPQPKRQPPSNEMADTGVSSGLQADELLEYCKLSHFIKSNNIHLLTGCVHCHLVDSDVGDKSTAHPIRHKTTNVPTLFQPTYS